MTMFVVLLALTVAASIAAILSAIAGRPIMAHAMWVIAVILAALAWAERQDQRRRLAAQRAPFTTVEQGKTRGR